MHPFYIESLLSAFAGVGEREISTCPTGVFSCNSLRIDTVRLGEEVNDYPIIQGGRPVGVMELLAVYSFLTCETAALPQTPTQTRKGFG